MAAPLPPHPVEGPGRPARPARPARSRSGAGARGLATAFARWRWLVVVLAVVGLAAVAASRLGSGGDARQVDYSSLVGPLTAERAVVSVEVQNGTGRITGRLREGEDRDRTVRFETDGPAPAIPADIEALRAAGAGVRFTAATPGPVQSAAPYALALAAMVGLTLWMGRRNHGQVGGLLQVGRSRARVIDPERPATTFADVAGYEEVKEEVGELVAYLREPERFRELGARSPKGVLLVGPPGTGKTLFARAVAGEAGVAFFSVSGSDFMEMFVGVGAARVRDLFATARKAAPAIVFIDEIDSIGRKRGTGVGGGHDEREQTLNQLLAELDGFEASEGVVLIGASNRPDVLDPALLRPGRFDRQIVVPLPTLDERLPILRSHARDRRLGPDVDLPRVARGTPGMSGADLANLVNEAALHAVRRGGRQVSMVDFESARDRILIGAPRAAVVLGPEARESTAFHEAGHAVVAYVVPDADPVHKVTILPAGMALGVTQQLPLDERYELWREHLEAMLTVFMGGRCAEKIVRGSQSSGAGNDLQRATELARKMVRELGMSDRIGPMAWGSSGQVFLGEDLITGAREHAEHTARVIDEEVGALLRAAEARATDILLTHRSGLEAVAHALLAKETIDGSEVARLVDSAHGGPVHATGPKSLALPRLGTALTAPPPPPPAGALHQTPRYPADYGLPPVPPTGPGPVEDLPGSVPPVPPSQPPYDIERDPSWAR